MGDVLGKGRLHRLGHTAREYITHWTAAGAIVASTGFAPDHWIGHLLHDLPVGFRKVFPSTIDYRLLVVGLGVLIIIIDVLIRNRRRSVSFVDGQPHSPLPQVKNVSFQSSQIRNELTAERKSSIAVLPFNNLSGDPEQEYFCDGIVEEITTALSRIRWLLVIARNSSFTYKGRAVDVKQVGRELGVRYVLEGSIRKAGARIRITCQLIDADTGAHIWADRFDRELAEVFDLQDEVTQRVVTAIEPNVRSAEIARLRKKPTDHLDAYDLYLRALPALESYTEPSFREAEKLLRRAVEIDPNYSDAWASLADAIGRLAFGGFEPDQVTRGREACSAAERAVKLDQSNGTAFGMAAWAISTFTPEHDQGLVYAQRALSLQPNSAYVQALCASAFLRAGEYDKAIHHVEIATGLNPLDPRRQIGLSILAGAYCFSRRFEQARIAAAEASKFAPGHLPSLRLLAISLHYLELHQEAAAVMSRMRKLHPGASMADMQGVHFRDPSVKKMMQDALRQLGLPESRSRDSLIRDMHTGLHR